MDNQNVTITTEELKELIENAVYKAINGQTVNYEIITENELSKRIGISKVTLGKVHCPNISICDIESIKKNNIYEYFFKSACKDKNIYKNKMICTQDSHINT